MVRLSSSCKWELTLGRRQISGRFSSRGGRGTRRIEPHENHKKGLQS